MEAIIPVTAIPSVAPDHASLAGKVVKVDGDTAVQLVAKASAGAGTLTLLRHDGALTKWIPWGADSDEGSATIDSTKIEGWAHGRWATGSYTPGFYAILALGGPTIAEAYLGGLRL